VWAWLGNLRRRRACWSLGDIPGLLRYLRGHDGALPLAEVARLVAGAARLAGFDDLALAAAAAANDEDGCGAQDARVLYDFGFACLERRAGYLAVRPLALALELTPDAAPVLSELVTALEHDGQHARAVAVLEEHEPMMQWPHRFQYVYNALMAGSLGKAADGFMRLPEPADTVWAPAREKVRRMLARAGIARAVTPLDRQDLRGWHYVLTGGVLASLSPYGFDAGMTGRWAYLSDSADGCAAALQRLGLILDAAGAAPRSVALLPDRSSQILGAAAASILGLPSADFDPGTPAAHSIVVAYDLTMTDPGAVAALRHRAPSQIVFERATRWTDPPRIAADVSGLLGQTIIAPWAAQPRLLDDGTVGRARQTTAPSKPSPPRSPASPLNGTRATAALPRTPTTTCAASSKRSPPPKHANATATGSAASASTSPTPARYPAAASSEPTLRLSLTATFAVRLR
jgi:hypothetical protein